MFFRLALVSFILCELACSSEPVGTGFSSDESTGSEAAGADATGGEPRPHPVMCEPAGPVGTPDEELEAWRRGIHGTQWVLRREPSSREGAIQIARAMRHAANASGGESCRAIMLIARYTEIPCQFQSLQARAIMRCELRALAERCQEQTFIRAAHFGLYERGCGDWGNGEYQP